jgi:KDO2-lipid IV(A) lauroyltransferase
VLLPAQPSGLRRVYHALQAGGLAALLPDQVPAARSGRYAPFFGRPALTMTLAHRLLRSTGAVPMLASARRRDGAFELSFSRVPEAGQPDQPRALTAMNAAIEALVRTAPAQYQWEYRRFRRPPPGSPQPYRSRPDT